MLKEFFVSVFTDLNQNSEYILRMLLAAFLGCLIGLERSRRQKDAGIRTHMMVALGSALTMIISKYAFFDVVCFDGINLDASRIAANVTTGVSFLGAGVIFVKNISIKGLTTAAGIWTTAAIGLAIGAGMYSVGITGALLMMVIQLILHRFFSGLENTVNEFTVVMTDNPGAVDSFNDAIKNINLVVESCNMKRTDNTIELDYTIKKARNTSMNEIMRIAQNNKDIISIET